MSGVENETPSLNQVLKDVLNSRLLEMHTSMPASIESYDGKKANVRPLLKRQFKDGTVVDLPIISNVPVIWPGNNDSILIFPIKKGDTGTLLFSERSLDTWLVQGGSVNPGDPRKFDLSDAQFIPGLRPFNVDTPFDPEKAILQNALALLKLSPSGKFELTNGTVELLDLMVQWITESSKTLADIITHTHTSSVPTTPSSPPLNAAVFTAIKVLVDAIKVKLETLKV